MSLLYEGFSLETLWAHYGPNLEVEVTVTAAILQKKRDWQAY